MRPVTFTLVHGLLRRLRSQAGMTIVETMVAAVILTAGVLGVFVMVETADKVNEANRGREAATSLSREILEKARTTAFADVGDSNWLDSSLSTLDGGTGNVVSPTVGAARTEVTRRDVEYAVQAETCSVDDSKDGLKTSPGGVTWCADSTGTGAGDSQPEDMKRVGVTTQWTQGAKSYSLYQAATFSSAGSVVGPNLTEFKVTNPPGLEAETAPVITTNPSPHMTFQATSVGAADMKFTIDGVARTTGVKAAGNGTWTLDWNTVPLKDGVYTIGATAVDVLGTHGDPQYIQVTLARGAPTPLTNVVGGYNDVYAGDVKKRVVELAWSAAPEGSVTGYEVVKGATPVCSASLLTECMDLNPATSGDTTYTIKTLYTDAAGNPGSMTTNYTVSAPAGGGGSTQSFWHASTSAISQTNCLAPTNKQGFTGSRRDAQATAPAGSEATWTNAANGNNNVGCMPPFTAPTTMTASTTGMTVSGWFKNTAATQCKLSWQVFKNANITLGVAGNGYGGGSSDGIIVPANTTNPTQFTKQLGVTAQSFIAGDQLSIMVGGFSGNTADRVCTSTTMYFNSAARPAVTTLPLSGGGGGGGGTITRPAAPTGLAGTANADGTTTLSWTAPGGTPVAEFYRIYRDGQNYTERIDTSGDDGTTPIQWVDTNTGGTTHVYRVTAVSSALAESDFAGPLTR
jgi:Tfp pilus assembly protein PilV